MTASVASARDEKSSSLMAGKRVGVAASSAVKGAAAGATVGTVDSAADDPSNPKQWEARQTRSHLK